MPATPRLITIAAWFCFIAIAVALLGLRPAPASPIPESGCHAVAVSRADEYLKHPLALVLGSSALRDETARLRRGGPGPTCAASLELGIAATAGLELMRQQAMWAVLALALALGGTHLASVGSMRAAAFITVASLVLLGATRRTPSLVLVIPFILLTIAAARAWRRRRTDADQP